jgi:hypothetical protein
MPGHNKIHLFNSLDTLKILRFWDIIKNNNIYLLDFDYFDGKEYSKNEVNEIEVLWNRLYDEYFILRDDSMSKAELSKSFDGLLLQAKIVNLSYALNALYDLKEIQGYLTQEQILNKRKELYATLIKVHPKIQYQLFNSVELDIDYILKFKNSLQNSYNFNYKPKEKVNDEQIKNVFDIVANVESWLERSLPVDDISVSRWLAYEKQVIQKQKAQSNGKQ